MDTIWGHGYSLLMPNIIGSFLDAAYDHPLVFLALSMVALAGCLAVGFSS